MTISPHCHDAVRALIGVALAGILVVLPAAPVDAGSSGPRQGSVHDGQGGGKGGGPSPPGQKPGGAPRRDAGPSDANRNPAPASSPAPKFASAPSPAPGKVKPASVSRASIRSGSPAPGHRKAGHAGKVGRGSPHDRDDAEPERTPVDRSAPGPSPAPTASVAPAAASDVRFSGTLDPKPAPAEAESAAPALPEVAAPLLGPSIIDRARGLVPEPGEAVPAVRDPTIPLLLVVALGAYALIVGRGDRRDPKLARSSVDPGPKGVGFR